MPDAAAPFSGAHDSHHVDDDTDSRSATRPCIIIVSSVRLFREGLAELAERGGEWHTIGLARDLAEARACLTTSHPTVALIDASDDDALDLAQLFARAQNVLGVIAFATSDDVDARLLLAEAGVSGYVSRDGSIADVLAAIDRGPCLPARADGERRSEGCGGVRPIRARRIVSVCQLGVHTRCEYSPCAALDLWTRPAASCRSVTALDSRQSVGERPFSGWAWADRSAPCRADTRANHARAEARKCSARTGQFRRWLQ